MDQNLYNDAIGGEATANGDETKREKEMEAEWDAPPDYYQVLMDDIPNISQYEAPILEGVPPAYTVFPTAPSAHLPYPGHDALPPQHMPYIMYADFLPKLLTPGTDLCHPTYGNFRSLMNFVNSWLESNPHFIVYRCESIERKIKDPSGLVETESTIYHEAIYGTMLYLRALRLWVGYRHPDNTDPPQKLGYVNVVPKANYSKVNLYHSHHRGFGNYTSMVHAVEYPVYEDLGKTVERFNEQLAEHPLPGKVLTIESIDLKHKDTWTKRCLDPDATFWQEKKSSMATKLYLTFFRIFFVQGTTANETIDFVDIVPDITRKPPPNGYPSFEPYSNLIVKANQWVKFYDKTEVRVTNLQTIQTKVESSFWSSFGEMILLGTMMNFVPSFRQESQSNQYTIDTLKSDFQERSVTQFVKVIRIAFTRGPDLKAIVFEKPPLNVTSRLFTPIWLGTKNAETTSRTVQRINEWLQLTGAHVIGADTISYEFTPTVGKINTDNVSHPTHMSKSHYFMMTIRLYFDGEYSEPPGYVEPVQQYHTSECCTML